MMGCSLSILGLISEHCFINLTCVLCFQCLKESYIKADGTGLSYGLEKLNFEVDQAWPPPAGVSLLHLLPRLLLPPLLLPPLLLPPLLPLPFSSLSPSPPSPLLLPLPFSSLSPSLPSPLLLQGPQLQCHHVSIQCVITGSKLFINGVYASEWQFEESLVDSEVDQTSYPPALTLTPYSPPPPPPPPQHCVAVTSLRSSLCPHPIAFIERTVPQLLLPLRPLRDPQESEWDRFSAQLSNHPWDPPPLTGWTGEAKSKITNGSS